MFFTRIDFFEESEVNNVKSLKVEADRRSSVFLANAAKHETEVGILRLQVKMQSTSPSPPPMYQHIWEWHGIFPEPVSCMNNAGIVECRWSWEKIREKAKAELHSSNRENMFFVLFGLVFKIGDSVIPYTNTKCMYFNQYFSGWICSPISAPSILVSCSSFCDRNFTKLFQQNKEPFYMFKSDLYLSI